MIDIHHPHDSLFKYIFSNVENFKTFLKHFIPDIYKNLDLNSVKLLNTEKQAENKKKFFLDLAFECKLDNLNSQIYVVFEHKSYPDKLVPIQIMYYCASVWEQDLREKKDYTPIIPIVFYHGKQKWNIPKNLQEHFKNFPLKDYMIDFNYYLIDLSRLDDNYILKNIHDNLCLMATIYTMKNIFDDIKKLKPVVKELIIAHNQDCTYIILNYTVAITKKPEVIESMILETGGKEEMMLLTDKWKLEGLQEGLKKGYIKSILNLINLKFQPNPEELQTIENKLSSFEDEQKFEEVLRIVATADSFEEVKNKIL
ncbi:Rpn family recombination-promoting nuclease/putative transposase [Sulfurihydrogenibium azorense]|nr:Rpn family recombination-promoting nuclease/putative transposase [Sulfurihydrogenibium azorense]MDM7273901.1 Rpn family recombination-promoting nuclease/putative transposase [Sulfurihydrogenibium azorense]